MKRDSLKFKTRLLVDRLSTDLGDKVGVQIIWSEERARSLGTPLPGPHTVGLLITLYGESGEFSQIIPVSKERIRQGALDSILETVIRVWRRALIELMMPEPSETVKRLLGPDPRLSPPNGSREVRPL